MKIWFDVDDLFHFSDRSQRPTGIQRLTGEAYIALMFHHPDKVAFVRHADAHGGFVVVNWPDVLATYQRLVSGSPRRATPAPVSGRPRSLFGKLRGIVPPRSARSRPIAPMPTRLSEIARAGDVLCSLGAPWHDADYAARVAHCKKATGMRFAAMIHDLIPLVRPEYFELGRAPHFEQVVRGVLALADAILTNSKSTAADVSAWASHENLALKAKPTDIPIGSGFSKTGRGQLPAGLRTGEYVLFVSTIEIRKNHLQAFRVWCRLLRELPQDKVPTLVLAGGWGWMVEDLRKAIEATRYVDGKLAVVLAPDDATLAALYHGCRFTLYLSHYEGWGLPVSDSLSFGKVCVASDRTSMPEAGGAFCVYVDPDNTTEAFQKIRDLIEIPDLLGRLEAELQANYKPTSWSTTADAIIQTLLPDSENTFAEVRADAASQAAAAPSDTQRSRGRVGRRQGLQQAAE